jgi:hypothetical protein
MSEDVFGKYSALAKASADLLAEALESHGFHDVLSFGR